MVLEDYVEKGLWINVICFGYVELFMMMNILEIKKVLEEKVVGVVFMKRVGKFEEIVDGVVFLVGGRSLFVMGSIFVFDGGYI